MLAWVQIFHPPFGSPRLVFRVQPVENLPLAPLQTKNVRFGLTGCCHTTPDRGRFNYPPESTPSPYPTQHRMVSSRLVTSSRRAGRVTNKTKLLVVRGTKEADDLGDAEVVVWEDGSTSANHQAANGSESSKHNHVGAKGVESGELLVSRPCSFFLPMHPWVIYISTKVVLGGLKQRHRRGRAWEPIVRVSRFGSCFRFQSTLFNRPFRLDYSSSRSEQWTRRKTRSTPFDAWVICWVCIGS